MMKNVFTLAIALASVCAHAQFPNLPYNPDENGDGLIGVVDLQGLLANYGNEFASAILSEDGESAIMYMGQMGYPQCKYSCDHLPGMWTLAEVSQLSPVLDSLSVDVWLESKSSTYPAPNNGYMAQGFYKVEGSLLSRSTNMSTPFGCYCAAKQLPRVEYSYCYAQGYGGLDECSSSKMSEGWYPMGGVATSANSNYSSSVHFVQAFWRWAE